MEPKRAARTGSAERHGSKRELTGINCVLVIYSTVKRTRVLRLGRPPPRSASAAVTEGLMSEGPYVCLPLATASSSS